MQSWTGRHVLITGVCGTVGREILAQLLRADPASVVGLDNNESELFFLDQEIGAHEPRLSLFLGDVRHGPTLHRAMNGIDVVLHAAAFKHVYLCEQSPEEAVQTNILGVQAVIEAAEANGVERVLFTSSDKAVNPTSVMGTSKLMGERLITAADRRRRGAGPVFASTRFGNVLGSRGSVIPLFQRQIAAGGPVTLTDPGMTRFIMTLQEAVGLTLDSVFMARGGEVFVTKMPVVRIEDLARVMVEELSDGSVAIETVGMRPGEKLYEELLNDEEVRRADELEHFLVIRPAVPPLGRAPDPDRTPGAVGPVTEAYNSANETPMSIEEIRVYLREHDLLTEGAS